MDAATVDLELQLVDVVASCRNDPLRFVELMYPWGEPGTPLEHEAGPDDNQREFLTALGREVAARGFDGASPVMPVLLNETSGHGTGKTAMCGWVTDHPCLSGPLTPGRYSTRKGRTTRMSPS